jgi:threonyl-tRNA synthetase
LRVLQIHCTSFNYTVRKGTPVAESPESNSEKLQNVLVCFICFEKKDEESVAHLVEKFVESLCKDVSRIKSERILLYPHAHLSKELGSPTIAKDFFNKLKQRLSLENIAVHKSPFGWYKTFQLECIGHPLAEAYREF